jgi:hypothetical protein
MAEKNKFPIVMKSTAAATAILTAVLFTVHHFLPFQGILVAAITVFTTCYHFSMRLMVGFLVPKCIHPHNSGSFFFRQRSFEPKLYSLLRVKKWKLKMPTYDPSSFSLKHNTLEQVIWSSCVAEAVHSVIIVFSFLPLLFSLWWGDFPIFLCTSLASALYDGLFVIMQRYNRPRLQQYLKRQGVSSTKN